MQFVFTTAEDGRVCPQCSGLQGSIYDVGDDVPDMPIHSNCRCRLLLFNNSNTDLVPFLPTALTVGLTTGLAVGLARNTSECPDGFHWDDDAAGCVPDED